MYSIEEKTVKENAQASYISIKYLKLLAIFRDPSPDMAPRSRSLGSAWAS
jgi:hypothetical protein